MATFANVDRSMGMEI